MRALSFAALFVLWSVAIPAAVQEPSQSALPEEAIIYQTAAIRVRRTVYPPGRHLPLHSHKARVVVFLSDGVVRTTTPDGQSHNMNFHRGMVYWSDPVRHTLDNVSAAPLDAAEVEFLKPYPAAQQPYTGDALKQDSAHFKMEFENDVVRVLRFSLGPHESSPMHDHLDRVVVRLLPLHARVTLPDGSQQEVNAPKDDIAFEPSVRHAVENLSDDRYEEISIELKPPSPPTPAAKRGH